MTRHPVCELVAGRDAHLTLSWIIPLLSFVLVCCLCVPIKAAGGVPEQRLRTYEQRAASVQYQLLDHDRRLSRAAAAGRLLSPSAVSPRVSVEFNTLSRSASSTFFTDDMESGANGWTVSPLGGSAPWHESTLDANSPTHSWWPGVEGQGNYHTGARVHEELISPLISLAGAAGNVTLLFTENYFTERSWDFCMVDVSNDGGSSWIHLRGGYGESPSGDSHGWKVSTLDLTAYANESINLRFVFDTGDSVFNAFPGWFVDNVAVYDHSSLVSGAVYYDQNRNGLLDAGERGLPDWFVTVAGPLTLTMPTAWDGTFRLPLPLGSYALSEVLQPPWTQTSDPTTANVVLDTAGEEDPGLNFGNYRLGCLLLGSVFDDLNKDSLLTPGEPPFLVPWIEVTDSAGYWDDGGHPDTSGNFTFFVFGTGHYRVSEYLPPYWVSTVPPGRTPRYDIVVPPKDTSFTGFLFGSYEHITPAHSRIHGSVFNDLNRSGALDDREPPLTDWFVALLDSNGTSETSTHTDSIGGFAFENLVAGKYVVRLDGPCGWHQSVPAGTYAISLDSGQVKDSVVFGEYALVHGSIRGIVFNDLNASGTRDPGEPPISGSSIYLTGVSCFGKIHMSAESDDSGHFQFEGLWIGSYSIRIAMSAHWRQTLPGFHQQYTIALGNEEQRTGTDYGLSYDSTFNIAFRSFLPESIAYVRGTKGMAGAAVKPKAVGSEATFTLVAPLSGLRGLHVEFSQTIVPSGPVAATFPAPASLGNFKRWEFTLPGAEVLEEGDSIVIFAVSDKPKQVFINKYWWEDGGVSPALGTVVGRRTDGNGILLFPMPNIMNVLQAMYTQGLPTKYGLTVGLVPGWHSAYASNSVGVWKSLYEHGHVHVGPPRCIGISAKSLKPIRKSVNILTPSVGNNILFAEALALKANIVASDFGITPFGFGSLIFHGDSANPFDGLSVRRIAAKLDTSLSQFDDNILKVHVGGDTCFCNTTYFNTAYETIRMIDSAFSGPFDTVAFTPGLIVKPVRLVSAVPYLTIDSSFSSIAAGVTPRNAAFAEQPLRYALEQNYPNPFNPTTTLSFTLAKTSLVTLKVYNLLGEEVVTLLEKELLDEGTQEITFNAGNLASGVYFYRITADGISDPDSPATARSYIAVKKMVLLK